MPAMMACAKVNLTLRITGKRPDGYHLLDSLVVFASVGDMVTVGPSTSGKIEFAVSGRRARGIPTDNSNLVVKAAEALAARAETPVSARMHLDKQLPVAAGIGGGSADAAACLDLLNDYWSLGLSSADLAEIGLRLGADIPACLAGRPVRMTGIGDVLTPLPALPSMGILLVNDGTDCPTGPVFGARAGAFSAARPLPEAFQSQADLIAFLEQDQNDLEAPAMALHPSIRTVKETVAALPGCSMARMSGSGATIFGLFPTRIAAQEAGQKLHEETGWWAAGSDIRRAPLILH